MDSQVQLEGRLIDIVDEAWRRDTLPEEEIAVPLYELPDPEPDNSNNTESLRQQEHTWNDLALQRLAEPRQPADLDVTMAELPGLGEHCGLASCRQLDFLPIACHHCTRTFCRDHVAVDAHDCDKRPEPAQANLSSSTRIYACHVPDCGAAELTPVACPDCGLACCLTHRHPAGHACAVWQAQQADAARRLPDFQRADALQAERLSAAPVVPGAAKTTGSERARRTARQVQLMRLKQRAVGAGSVPLGDRRYLLLVAPGGRGSPRPVFVSRRWTLGRAVDALADLCGAVNENDKTGGRKLLLYRYADGGRVGDAMNTAIEELPDGQLDNAETVVLEYGDPADTGRSDVTKYDLK